MSTKPKKAANTVSAARMAASAATVKARKVARAAATAPLIPDKEGTLCPFLLIQAPCRTRRNCPGTARQAPTHARRTPGKFLPPEGGGTTGSASFRILLPGRPSPGPLLRLAADGGAGLETSRFSQEAWPPLPGAPNFWRRPGPCVSLRCISGRPLGKISRNALPLWESPRPLGQASCRKAPPLRPPVPGRRFPGKANAPTLFSLKKSGARETFPDSGHSFSPSSPDKTASWPPGPGSPGPGAASSRRSRQ